MVEYKIYRNENRDIYYLIRKMSHEIFILTIVCCSLVFCVVKKCGGGKRKRKREGGGKWR